MTISNKYSKNISMGETKKSTKSNAEKKNNATTKSSTVKKTSTKTNSKSKGRKNGKRGVWETVLLAILVIASVVWFFGGKPNLTVYDDGFYIAQTEEPLINRITGKEIVPFKTDLFGVGEKLVVEAPAESAESAESAPATEKSSETIVKPASKKSGSEYSSAEADLNHAENNPLHFGNPTDAFADVKNNTNYLMVKPQYTLSYNTETLCPNWVAWHLCAEDMGSADRMDDFRPDPDLPEGWYGVKKADYQYNAYGYDRGHVCPSADRTATKEDNSMTFLMTNMVPQSPDNNRVIWMHFENYERELVKQGNEVYIIAGPYGTGGTGAKGTFDEVPIKLKSGEVLHMNVPAYTWKVLIAIPDGSDDMSRISTDSTVIAINVPNQMGMGKTGDWEQFLCSIDDIEALTGYDFFELLPDSIEAALESKVYTRL